MILDIIVIALLALSGYMGYKKGLVGILVSFVSLILAIVLAFILQGPISQYLYEDTGMGTSLEQSVKSVVEKNINTEEGESKILFLDKVISDQQEEGSLVDNAAKQLTLYILKGISFIGVLVLVFIICYILQMLLNLVFDLPLLSSVNKFGGVGLNIIKTLVKFWIVLALISFIATIPFIQPIVDTIEKSTVTKLLYHNNMLVTLIESSMK